MNYVQGRVFAISKAEAIEKIERKVITDGLLLIAPPKVWTAPVQFCRPLIWWEYLVRVDLGGGHARAKPHL